MTPEERKAVVLEHERRITEAHDAGRQNPGGDRIAFAAANRALETYRALANAKAELAVEHPSNYSREKIERVCGSTAHVPILKDDPS
jgi:hypothetical protein